MTDALRPEPIAARTIAVLADCHIHPGGGPDWSPAALDALRGVDLILTLGDMGEAAGLDRLAAIAPVLGVRGLDDSDDPRTAPRLRAFQIDGLLLGCVFDPEAAGIVAAKDPFRIDDDCAAAAEAFGCQINILLYGSTHKTAVESIAWGLAINPGSLTLPDGDGASGTFALLTIERGGLESQIISVPR